MTPPRQEGVIKTHQFKYKDYISVEDFQTLLTELEALRACVKAADFLAKKLEDCADVVKEFSEFDYGEEGPPWNCDGLIEESEDVLDAYFLTKKAAGLEEKDQLA